MTRDDGFPANSQVPQIDRPFPVPSLQEMDDTAPMDRRGAARGRARSAKTGLLIASVAVFAGGLALTRSTAAGHTKQAIRPLAAPRRFVRTVRQNALAAGAIAPPQQAPPQATTSTS